MPVRPRVAEQSRYIADYIRRSAEALNLVAANRELQATIEQIGLRIGTALNAGSKLLLAGNGGSAADSQHLAAEFVSRFANDRRPLPAIALTTDTSALTAIGNDYGFEKIFERQLRGLARENDVFLALSTSGRSPNVIAALHAAREIGVTTIGFTGRKANPMSELCDLCLLAPSDETSIIQQIHIVAGHAVCGFVEQGLLQSTARQRDLD